MSLRALMPPLLMLTACAACNSGKVTLENTDPSAPYADDSGLAGVGIDDATANEQAFVVLNVVGPAAGYLMTGSDEREYVLTGNGVSENHEDLYSDADCITGHLEVTPGSVVSINVSDDARLLAWSSSPSTGTDFTIASPTGDATLCGW